MRTVDNVKWEGLNVDLLDHSDDEKQAVIDMKEYVSGFGGWSCLVRMLPPRHNPTRPVEYWATAAWTPKGYWTEKAATPALAARALLEKLKAGSNEHEDGRAIWE